MTKTLTASDIFPFYPLRSTDTPLFIASSAGGPAVLKELLSKLPPDLPIGGVIVQHMGAQFTGMLSESLDRYCAYHVKEAQPGDAILSGRFLLAPGGYHLVFDQLGRAHLDQGPPVNSVKPAADVTMHSLTRLYGSRLVAVVLTGCGKDGTEGARAIRAAGGFVMAQDKESSPVYGMPRAVIEAGLAQIIARPEMLAIAIATKARGNNKLI